MEEEHVSDEGSSLDEIWSSLANELHPCLVKVHVQLRRWVSDLPLRSPADEASMIGAIKAVARARRALWSRSVRRSAAAAGGAEGEGADASVGRDLQAFLVGWRALHKLLARLTKPPALLELPATLVRACDRLSRAARFDATRFRAVLWKHGGHPAAPRSAAQLGALRALRALALPLALPADCVGAALWRSQPSHPALWVGEDVRRELVNGACTLESIGLAPGTTSITAAAALSTVVDFDDDEEEGEEEDGEDDEEGEGVERGASSAQQQRALSLAIIPRTIELRIESRQMRRRSSGGGGGGGEGGGAPAGADEPLVDLRVPATARVTA
jgi:hypothetical protein